MFFFFLNLINGDIKKHFARNKIVSKDGFTFLRLKTLENEGDDLDSFKTSNTYI